MNILLITPQFPYPPRQGTTIRNYNLLQHLAARHTVDLLTFVAPTHSLPAESPLHAVCRRIAAVTEPGRSNRQRVADTVRSPLPDMALRLESADMHALVRQWVTAAHDPYDIVQVEGIEVAQYGMQIAAPFPAPALVFDNHNCEYLLQKRNALTDLRTPRRWAAAAYSLVQWAKLRRYEAQVCRAAAATTVVSEADKQALLRLDPTLDITVVSNGIDLSQYSCAPTTEAGLRRTLVFTGKMDYRPNIDAALWFAGRVLPLIRAHQPDVCFQIVGMNPHPRLEVLRHQPGIEITGAVPDPRPYIQAAAVYVIPLRVGGGTRFKALEAMACGKAIVSTSLGVEGIPVQHERELLLGDTPAAFAAAVVCLLEAAPSGDDLPQRLGQAARRFVEARYAWEDIVPIFEDVYRRIVPAARHA